MKKYNPNLVLLSYFPHIVLYPDLFSYMLQCFNENIVGRVERNEAKQKITSALQRPSAAWMPQSSYMDVFMRV